MNHSVFLLTVDTTRGVTSKSAGACNPDEVKGLLDLVLKSAYQITDIDRSEK